MGKRATLLVLIGLLTVTTPPALAIVPVSIPEYWGGSDWLGFFTLASIAFAMMVRRKVLKPRVGR